MNGMQNNAWLFVNEPAKNLLNLKGYHKQNPTHNINTAPSIFLMIAFTELQGQCRCGRQNTGSLFYDSEQEQQQRQTRIPLFSKKFVQVHLLGLVCFWLRKPSPTL